MLRYQTLPVTPFAQNCFLVWDDDTKQAAVIDPGGDLDRLLALVEQLGVKLEEIWLTHAHIDHAGGMGELARRLGLPIVGPHPGDQFWIDGIRQRQWTMGDETVFIPGHGPESSFGREQRSNPYVRDV